MEALPDVVKDFVREAKVCRIATSGANGKPHIIPVCPAFDGDAAIYVDLTRHGASARALRRNSKIAVLIDEYYDDWSKLKAVILHCTAEEVKGSELDSAWALFREKFPQGAAIRLVGASDPGAAGIRVDGVGPRTGAALSSGVN